MSKRVIKVSGSSCFRDTEELCADPIALFITKVLLFIQTQVGITQT